MSLPEEEPDWFLPAVQKALASLLEKISRIAQGTASQKKSSRQRGIADPWQEIVLDDGTPTDNGLPQIAHLEINQRATDQQLSNQLKALDIKGLPR